MPDSLTYLSLTGMLGYGYPPSSLEKGLEADPEFIGVDAGSTDPGPYYLGSDETFVGRSQVAQDLGPALQAAVNREIPLIIGTAGGAGARPHVEAFLETLQQVATEQGLCLDVAVIYADIEARILEEALVAGRISPCGPVPELRPEEIYSCTNIVGQMGTEPLMEAIETGADVVVAGRCCDAAIFAALPIMRGFDPALGFHAAKIAECGTLCARPGGANDSLICTLQKDCFTVRPASDEKACYPDTVAAHTLYEQPQPDQFDEPEGVVHVSACQFEQAGDRAVTVRGTRLKRADKKTLKIEGASPVGYRTIAVAGTRDPGVIENLDILERGARKAVADSIDNDVEYTLRFIRYGRDGILGDIERQTFEGHEVGIVIEAVAENQQAADAICSLARSTALHHDFEGRKTTAGNLAFPFSPSDFSGGAVYEFSVYHLLEGAEQSELFSPQCREMTP